MMCHYCQAEMKRDSSPFHVDRHGYHLSFDKIPAWVCSQCGQAYFEENEVNEIQRAINELDEHALKVQIAA